MRNSQFENLKGIILSGDFEKLKEGLIQIPVTIFEIKDSHGMTLLQYAIEKEERILKEVLSKTPETVFENRNIYGVSILHQAVSVANKNKLEALKVMLPKVPDSVFEMKNRHGRTPLMCASNIAARGLIIEEMKRRNIFKETTMIFNSNSNFKSNSNSGIQLDNEDHAKYAGIISSIPNEQLSEMDMKVKNTLVEVINGITQTKINLRLEYERLKASIPELVKEACKNSLFTSEKQMLREFKALTNTIEYFANMSAQLKEDQLKEILKTNVSIALRYKEPLKNVFLLDKEDKGKFGQKLSNILVYNLSDKGVDAFRRTCVVLNGVSVKKDYYKTAISQLTPEINKLKRRTKEISIRKNNSEKQKFDFC